MIRRLRNLPLPVKLTGLTLVTCGIALGVAITACFAFLFQFAREHERDDLVAVSHIIADNAVANFDFHDASGAAELLRTLRVRQEILAARLVDSHGALFASYTQEKTTPPSFPPMGGPRRKHRWSLLDLAQPVAHHGDASPLGTLQIEADISGTIRRFMAAGAMFFGGILICALALAYALGYRLQRAITGPILALAATARRVAETDDYALRATKFAEDEVGRLTDAFNFMLAQHEGRREMEKQLEQTQRLESLGVLAGGIAHDFNNILTGILCSASLAKMEAARGSEAYDHLQRIETSSRRAAELCEQMLAYAGKNRSEQGTSVHFNTLIQETLELLHASVPKDAELAIDLDPNLPHAAGDPSRVRQVLMNLVINAGEALRDPPRRIALKTRRARLSAEDLARMSHRQNAAAGDFVVVEVADTGVGMSADQLRRIFEPFYTSKFTGRGLGLSSVLGILRSCGGALNVSSQIGRGTTFAIAFPATEAPREDPAEPVEAADPSAKGRARGTVLVVDDEKSVREVAAAALKRMGFEVLSTEDGVQAVKLVSEYSGPLQGVLLDVTMPGMDGAATLQQLRRIRPELKAILMSGYDEQASLRRFQDLGVGAFLHKPFTAEALSARTDAWD